MIVVLKFSMFLVLKDTRKTEPVSVYIDIGFVGYQKCFQSSVFTF